VSELERKLGVVREVMLRHDLGAVRLRGLDWTAWATCGASAAVLLTAETGVAEVLVAPGGAWVLTDVVEEERLRAEELPRGLEVVARAWWDGEGATRFAAEVAGGRAIASDRPAGGERPLPRALPAARATLLPEELARYRALGRDAAEAATEVLSAAGAGWSGLDLAGAAAEALWSRGIHPALTLVGCARRLEAYRHPTPTGDRLGGRAMLVLAARRHGLHANLTRFVSFRTPPREERERAAAVARVEAAALEASRPGASLGTVFDAVVAAYAREGHPGEEARHHQGGPCGYRSRDALATPGSPEVLAGDGAVAWNPSLPGAKIEDTVVVRPRGVEILTCDPRWPTAEVAGRARPEVLVR
jgi:Xaa-Pro aminopeptidase